MIRFEVDGVGYIGLAVPDDACYFTVEEASPPFIQYMCKTGKEVWHDTQRLPAGNYEIVGLLKDLPIDTLYPLELGYKNSTPYMGQDLNKPIFTPNTLILKITNA